MIPLAEKQREQLEEDINVYIERDKTYLSQISQYKQQITQLYKDIEKLKDRNRELEANFMILSKEHEEKMKENKLVCLNYFAVYGYSW